MNKRFTHALALMLALILVMAWPMATMADNGLTATSNEVILQITPRDTPVDTDKEDELELSFVGSQAYGAPGDVVNYEITLKNSGETDCETTVQAMVPAGLTIESYDSGASANGQTISWDVLVGGKDLVTLGFTASVDEGATGELVTDVTAANTSASAKLTVSESQLILLLSADRQSVLPGEKVNFLLQAVNLGDAQGEYTIHLTSPADMTMMDFDDANVTPNSGNDCNWTVTIPANGNADLNFSATAPAQGGSKEFMAQDANDTAVADYATVRVGTPNITLTKEVDETEPYAGDQLVYTITLSNTGDGDAEDLTVVDTLPKGLIKDWISQDGLWNKNDRTITWSLGLAAGETLRLTVAAYVPDDAQADHDYVNVVTCGDLTATATSTVQPYPDPILTITQSVSNRTPEAGDWIRYTIRVKNSGGEDAQDVKITDTLPWELTIDEDSISRGGDYYASDDKIVWYVDVDAGETVKLSFLAQIPDDAEDGDSYRNYAKIAGGDSSRLTVYVTDGLVPKTGDPAYEAEYNK